jgi:hypothetical protein
MVEALAIVLTCIPVLAGALAGARIGAPRILAFGLPLAIAWAAGIGTLRLGLGAGWFEPLGLVTPVCLGLAAAIIARGLAARLLAPALRAPLAASGPGSIARSAAGAALGGAAGVAAAASLWLGALLLDGALSPRAPDLSMEPDAGKGESLVRALVRTANKGFVRHLPLVGELGDEVEALSFILSARPEARARLARELGWERLSDLPSLQAILNDEGTLADIEGAGAGDVAALYRLQKNELIIAFFREDDVQEIIAETRPSTLARGLAAIEAGRRTGRRR